MIKSKKDYKEYLKRDKEAIGKDGKKIGIFKSDIVIYQSMMRKSEYYYNCKGKFYRPYYYFLEWKRYKLGKKLGFSIPINVFGPGLSIAHKGTIVINNKVRIGSNCRLHVCVNIGVQLGGDKAPIIGDNVYIGPGAKIFGDIKIANGIKIGANAVVNKTFNIKNVSIGGVPAKVLNSKNNNC